MNILSVSCILVGNLILLVITLVSLVEFLVALMEIFASPVKKLASFVKRSQLMDILASLIEKAILNGCSGNRGGYFNICGIVSDNIIESD